MYIRLDAPKSIRRVAALGVAIVAILGAARDAAAQPMLEPADGLTCLIVNKNSGRCLSVADHSINPGARIVQGPFPDKAGASERWTLLAAGKAFRVRNHRSRLVLEIGSANVAPGVQAIQWHDRPNVTHLLWTFEPEADHYRLRVGHADLVLGVQEGSKDAGARAIQWNEQADVPDQLWELQPAFQEHYWSFKTNAGKRGDFELIGPDAADCVKFEPEGLRITLPLGHPDRRPSTGVVRNLDLKGDFEITIGYEIVGEPAPADSGQGTGLFVGIDLEAERNRATLMRGVRDRTLITSWFELTEKSADKPFKTGLKSLPTKTRTGQLRMSRIDAELLCEVASAPGAEFVLMDRHPFSDQDVLRIRIGGDTGGPAASLDARVIDLRIRAKNVPGAAAPAGASRDEAAPPRDTRIWLVVMLVGTVTAALLLALVIGGFVLWRRGKSARKASKDSDEPVESSPISFACPECGKNLKARQQLAGKKLKCPHCGNSVQAPLQRSVHGH